MITGWIVGDREVVAKLERMPSALSQRARACIVKWAIKIEAAVKSAKLSGQVLKVRTGTLRRSVVHTVTDSSDSISAVVGTNVKYAAYHEYGFEGVENVKSHLRTMRQAWGHPLKAGSMKIQVRAHSREVNYPARSFLRSVLREYKGAITADLTSEIGQSAKV